MGLGRRIRALQSTVGLGATTSPMTSLPHRVRPTAAQRPPSSQPQTITSTSTAGVTELPPGAVPQQGLGPQALNTGCKGVTLEPAAGQLSARYCLSLTEETGNLHTGAAGQAGYPHTV